MRVRKFNALRFEALLDFLVEAVLEIKPVTLPGSDFKRGMNRRIAETGEIDHRRRFRKIERILPGRIQENLPDAG
jgi:hypothetical protein